MGRNVKMTMEQLLETGENKVKVTFTFAVGRYQQRKITTDATIDIVKYVEYAQEFGAELLTNPHVLFYLKVSITDYVRTTHRNSCGT